MTTQEILTVLQVAAIIGGGGWAIYLFLVSQEIQRAQLYKEIEFKSTDVLLRAVDKPELYKLYDPQSDVVMDDPTAVPLASYAYSILTLFELMFNLQKKGMLPKEIFITWIEWYWEFSRGQFGSQLWVNEANPHFSSDFSELMNKFVSLGTTQRKDAYEHAMKIGLISHAEFTKWLQSHWPSRS